MSSSEITTDSLRGRATHWTLADDARLRQKLQQLSQSWADQGRQLTGRLADLDSRLESTATRLGTVTNQFLHLSNTQFIENRVYEDSDPEIESGSTSGLDQKQQQLTGNEEREKVFTEKVAEALKTGINFIETSFEQVKFENSDSDDDEEAAKILEPIFEVHNPYQLRNLPHLIGTVPFLNEDNIGLGDLAVEDDVKAEVHSDDESESEDSDLDDDERTTRHPAPTGSYDNNSEYSISESDEDDEADRAVTRKKPTSNMPLPFKPDEKSKITKSNMFGSESDTDEDNLFSRRPPVDKDQEDSASLASGQSAGLSNHSEEGVAQTAAHRPPPSIFADELAKRIGAPPPRRSSVASRSSKSSRLSEHEGSQPSAKGSSLFADSDSDDDGLFTAKPKLPPPKPPHASMKPKAATANKIDDRVPDVTNKKLAVESTTKHKKKSLFDDSSEESDDGLFAPPQNRVIKSPQEDASSRTAPLSNATVQPVKVTERRPAEKEKPKEVIKASSKKVKSLFDDDSSEEDLFSSKPASDSRPKGPSAKKKSLAEPALAIAEASSKAEKSIPAAKVKPVANLFGDDSEEDADDDIFSVLKVTDKPAEKPALFINEESSKVPTSSSNKYSIANDKKSPSLFGNSSGDEEDDLLSQKPPKVSDQSGKQADVIKHFSDDASEINESEEVSKPRIPVGGVAVFSSKDLMNALKKRQQSGEDERPDGESESSLSQARIEATAKQSEIPTITGKTPVLAKEKVSEIRKDLLREQKANINYDDVKSASSVKTTISEEKMPESNLVQQSQPKVKDSLFGSSSDDDDDLGLFSKKPPTAVKQQKAPLTVAHQNVNTAKESKSQQSIDDASKPTDVKAVPLMSNTKAVTASHVKQQEKVKNTSQMKKSLFGSSDESDDEFGLFSKKSSKQLSALDNAHQQSTSAKHSNPDADNLFSTGIFKSASTKVPAKTSDEVSEKTSKAVDTPKNQTDSSLPTDDLDKSKGEQLTKVTKEVENKSGENAPKATPTSTEGSAPATKPKQSLFSSSDEEDDLFSVVKKTASTKSDKANVDTIIRDGSIPAVEGTPKRPVDTVGAPSTNQGHKSASKEDVSNVIANPVAAVPATNITVPDIGRNSRNDSAEAKMKDPLFGSSDEDDGADLFLTKPDAKTMPEKNTVNPQRDSSAVKTSPLHNLSVSEPLAQDESPLIKASTTKESKEQLPDKPNVMPGVNELVDAEPKKKEGAGQVTSHKGKKRPPGGLALFPSADLLDSLNKKLDSGSPKDDEADGGAFSKKKATNNVEPRLEKPGEHSPASSGIKGKSPEVSADKATPIKIKSPLLQGAFQDSLSRALTKGPPSPIKTVEEKGLQDPEDLSKTESNLLTSLNKSRPKVGGKRRPPTRRARLAAAASPAQSGLDQADGSDMKVPDAKVLLREEEAEGEAKQTKSTDTAKQGIDQHLASVNPGQSGNGPTSDQAPIIQSDPLEVAKSPTVETEGKVPIDTGPVDAVSSNAKAADQADGAGLVVGESSKTTTMLAKQSEQDSDEDDLFDMPPPMPDVIEEAKHDLFDLSDDEEDIFSRESPLGAGKKEAGKAKVPENVLDFSDDDDDLFAM